MTPGPMTPGRTPLEHQLSGPVPGRPTPLDAFLAARRAFQAGRRLDMQALAVEVGVNRATLYRWVGSREALLREVIWSLTERALTRRRAGTTPSSGSRLAAVLSGFVGDVLAHPGMRRLLVDEGESALRLLTLASGGYQQRLVALVHELVVADTAAGLLASPLPIDDLAYTVVRVVESYVYLEVITGESPDAARADRVLQALLPPGPASPQPSRRR